MDNNNPQVTGQAPTQPMGQPYPPQPMGQPYQAQPMLKPPKQPMDPAKKKKILIVSLLCIAGIAIISTLSVVLNRSLSQFSYSQAYNSISALEPKLDVLMDHFDCTYIVEHYDSGMTDINGFNERVNGCNEEISNDISNRVIGLGHTEGIKNVPAIEQQYEKFEKAFDEYYGPANYAKDEKLELYKIYHEFVARAHELDYDSSDEEYEQVAQILIGADNEDLRKYVDWSSDYEVIKNYGEKWLAYQLEVANAWKAWKKLPTTDPNYKEVGNTYVAKKDEAKQWIEDNAPDLTVLAPVEFGDSSELRSTFKELKRMVIEEYKKNGINNNDGCYAYGGRRVCEEVKELEE